MKRFTKTMYIRLGATVVCHKGNAVFSTHRSHEDEAASLPLGKLPTEMVRDVQMRHRVEPQGRLQQFPIKLKELAWIRSARIRDDKADIQIFRTLCEAR